ncbi:hypothetical protein [Ornithinimicrobium pratense]|uniref:Cell division protein FtsL n=1 Tax=Ornithinimicrobium pratense TaxID=2593973 RepID=A0A5J6V4N5_9MICO|nr:hypothetical protein [Ornithinimicrobium pratense]QFG68136.1 hypothetical protein FY030_04875 [Ornithinimicrobium pratense]
MSQMTISARLPRAARARTGARSVDASPARTNIGFLLLCAFIVASSFTAVLVLNTARAEGSYVLSRLEVQRTALHDQKVTLAEELAEKESPENLAGAAEKLKMVPSTSTATVRLSDGSITGVASKVEDGHTITVDLPSTGIPLPKDD